MPTAETSLRVLIVEDSADDAALVLRELRKSGYAPESVRVDSAEAMRAALKKKPWDIVLSDFMIPGFGGAAALKELHDCGLDVPFIIVSGKIDEETAVSAMKAGAHDYVMKNNLHRLAPAVARELRDAEVRRQHRLAEQEVARVNARIIEAHHDWMRAFDAVREPMFLHDKEFRIMRANRAYADQAGIPFKDIIGKVYWEMFPKGPGPLAGCRETRQSGKSTEEEISLETGATFLSRTTAIKNEEGEYLYSIHTMGDITGRKRAEETIRRTNRALKTLSSCNAALIHASNESELLDEMCRITVEIGGYRLAWVGFAEDDPQKTVRPIAQNGYGEQYIECANVVWSDTLQGRGPVGTAIRTRTIQVVQDAGTAPLYGPWRDHAVKLSYGSVLALPLLSAGAILGALSIYSSERDGFDAEEIRLLGELADDLAFGIVTLRTRSEHQKSAERLRNGMESTIEALAGTLEMRDAYTAGHQRRVAELSVAIAGELGSSEDEIHAIHLAGIVHDLGKIQIPAEILSKPAKLTKTEYEMIKAHPEAGYDILKEVDFPWPIAQIVYQHHERLDGSGYPRGLKGGETLPGAKILAVADTVEAMASHRPYRAALGIGVALEEITKNRGKIYDAEVVDACVKIFREDRFAFSV